MFGVGLRQGWIVWNPCDLVKHENKLELCLGHLEIDQCSVRQWLLVILISNVCSGRSGDFTNFAHIRQDNLAG